MIRFAVFFGCKTQRTALPIQNGKRNYVNIFGFLRTEKWDRHIHVQVLANCDIKTEFLSRLRNLGGSLSLVVKSHHFTAFSKRTAYIMSRIIYLQIRFSFITVSTLRSNLRTPRSSCRTEAEDSWALPCSHICRQLKYCRSTKKEEKDDWYLLRLYTGLISCLRSWHFSINDVLQACWGLWDLYC